MKSIFGNLTVLFRTLFFLVLIESSSQYVYSCNASAPCGCSYNSAAVSKIVGGEMAGTSTWSWAASISINGNSLCGGSILSSSWIITAAHCLAGASASKVTVYAGSNMKYSGQSRTASKLIIHSAYDSKTKLNDIALIQLSSPLTMSNTIKSICLPSVSSTTLAKGEWPPADLSVVAVGYGTLYEDGPTSTYLQQVTLKTVDYRVSTCRAVINYPQYQLCAGVSGGGKDTCQGDSGGPLMMFTSSNQWELVGLTSYGVGCGEAAYSGVYTRVAAYQSWISTQTSGTVTYSTSSSSANVNSNYASLFRLFSLFYLLFFIHYSTVDSEQV